MKLFIEFEREDDGRWLACVFGMHGVMAYGETTQEAWDNASILAIARLRERAEHGEIEMPDHVEFHEKGGE